jgi:hypothetical protein
MHNEVEVGVWAARVLSDIVGEEVEQDLVSFLVSFAVSADAAEVEVEVDAFLNAWTERVHEVGISPFCEHQLYCLCAFFVVAGPGASFCHHSSVRVFIWCGLCVRWLGRVMMCRQRGGRQDSKCITRSLVLRDTRPLFPLFAAT